MKIEKIYCDISGEEIDIETDKHYGLTFFDHRNTGDPDLMVFEDVSEKTYNKIKDFIEKKVITDKIKEKTNE